MTGTVKLTSTQLFYIFLIYFNFLFVVFYGIFHVHLYYTAHCTSWPFHLIGSIVTIIGVYTLYTIG